VVDPLGLVLKGGAWYLVARHRSEPRTYRVAAIESAQVLDERFVRPAAFDLAAFWSESTQRFEQGVYRDFATLRASAVGLNRLRSFSPIVAQAVERTMGPPDREGWRQVTVPIEAVEHAAREMLRLGDEAVVLEPAALRDALRATAAQMLAAYDRAQSASPPKRSTRAPARRTQDG
jgi:predicted DNA-binding transcriptional regulator YafY